MGTTQTQEVRNVLQNGVFNTCHFLWGWCQTKPSLLNPSDASLKVGTMRISTYRPCFLFVVLRSISVPGITSLSHQSMSFLFLQPYSNSHSIIIFCKLTHDPLALFLHPFLVHYIAIEFVLYFSSWSFVNVLLPSCLCLPFIVRKDRREG